MFHRTRLFRSRTPKDYPESQSFSSYTKVEAILYGDFQSFRTGEVANLEFNVFKYKSQFLPVTFCDLHFEPGGKNG